MGEVSLANDSHVQIVFEKEERKRMLWRTREREELFLFCGTIHGFLKMFGKIHPSINFLFSTKTVLH